MNSYFDYYFIFKLIEYFSATHKPLNFIKIRYRNELQIELSSWEEVIDWLKKYEYMLKYCTFNYGYYAPAMTYVIVFWRDF